MADDLNDFLARPLVARVAASGPSVRPVWFLWEDEAFWWLTDADSRLAARLAADPAAALVVDTCDLDTGTVLQVTANGHAHVVPLERDRGVRKLTRYLGADTSTWPQRFTEALERPSARLVRLSPRRRPVLRDLSFSPTTPR